VNATPWVVYIVESERGALYTGITTSLTRRFAEHGGAGGRGARFFRVARPKRVVYCESAADRRDALKREAQIKRLDRRAKLALIGTAHRSPP